MSGMEQQIYPTITRELILTAYKRALRTGKYFKLHPTERVILYLSTRILTLIKSPQLIEIIMKILDKVDEKLTLKIKAYQIGLQIAKKRIQQAIQLGYTQAKRWIKDVTYIITLGIQYLNTPPAYRPL